MVRKWIFFSMLASNLMCTLNMSEYSHSHKKFNTQCTYCLFPPGRNEHKGRYDANALQGANFMWNLRWIPLYRISLDWFSILIAVICLFLFRQSSVGMFSFLFEREEFHQTQNHIRNSNVCRLQMYVSKSSYIWANTRRKKKSIYPYPQHSEKAKKYAATDRNVYGEVSFEIGFWKCIKLHSKEQQEMRVWTKRHEEVRAKERRKNIRHTLSSWSSRLNDFGSVCLCAETIKIGTITISNGEDDNGDSDDDDNKKHTSLFDGLILCWCRCWYCTHMREKPIKSRHPLNARIYCFLCALLCFTSHCDLCSGFWLCFPFAPTIDIQPSPANSFNRQPSRFRLFYRSIGRNATISNIRMLR